LPSPNWNTPLSYRAVHPAYECLKKNLYMSIKSEIDELEGDIFDTSPITDSPANPFDTNVPLSTVTAAKKPRRFPPESKAILQSTHLSTRWPCRADTKSLSQDIWTVV
jgi:hypothetical protein